MASTTAPKLAAEGGSNGANGNAEPKLPPCGFLVKSGKKGNIPISVEKRPKGKKVTLISNVQGSAHSLLSALTSLLGSGGTVRQEVSGYHWTVELQGDQSERITSVLVQLGCVRGLRKPVEDRDKKKNIEVVSRVCAYDKFLRKVGPDDRSKTRAHAEAFGDRTCLPDADCSNWHGAWFYCRGRCTRSDISDVWGDTLDEKEGHDGRKLSNPTPKQPPSSTAELNIALRNLGLLPEVGGAHRLQRLTRNPASAGLTLGQYRKAAIAPGARLVTDEPNSKISRRGTSRPPPEKNCHERSKSLGTSRPSKPAKPPPPAHVGTYACAFCHCVFGLQKTWKLHMESVHPGTSSTPIKSIKTTITKMVSSSSVPRRAEEQRPVPGLCWVQPEVSKPKTPTKLPRQSSAKVQGSLRKQPRSKSSSHLSASREKAYDVHSAYPLCNSVSQGDLQVHEEVSQEKCNEHSPVSNGGDIDDVHMQVISDRAVQAIPFKAGDMCKVMIRFEPTIEEQEQTSQICVFAGEQVKVSFVPGDGFWVYVSTVAGNVDRQVKFGYVPLDILKLVEKTISPILAPQADPMATIEDQIVSNVGDLEEVPVSWLETLSLMNLSEAQFVQFESRYRYLRMNESLKLEDAWLAAWAVIQFDNAPPENKLSTELSVGLYAEAKEEMVLDCIDGKRTEEGEETEMIVVKAYCPDFDAQDQVRIRVSDHVLVLWRQPVEEGGHWAWVRPVDRPEQCGYIPLECIAPIVRCCKQASEVKPATPKGEQNLNPNEGTNCATEFPKLQEATVSHSGRSEARSSKQGRWNGLAKQSAKNTTRWDQHANFQTSIAEPCPLCGIRLQPGFFASHVEICFSRLEEVSAPTEVAQNSASSKLENPPAFTKETHAWAKAKILDLVDRFCITSQLDADVALASLGTCKSANEMRIEATSLIFENQPVKNFAAELWRRRTAKLQ